jgi:hypothetical protein
MKKHSLGPLKAILIFFAILAVCLAISEISRSVAYQSCLINNPPKDCGTP